LSQNVVSNLLFSQLAKMLLAVFFSEKQLSLNITFIIYACRNACWEHTHSNTDLFTKHVVQYKTLRTVHPFQTVEDNALRSAVS